MFAKLFGNPSTPYIDLPFQWIGWIGWLLFAGLLTWGVIHYWHQYKNTFREKLLLYVLLVVLAPLCTLLLNIHVNSSELVPIPNLPIESVQPVIIPFFALPLVLAAGFLGPVGATFIGSVSGLFLAFFSSHSIYTPLEVAGVGLLFGMAVGQNYRTAFYKLLRHPIGAAFIVAIAYIPLFLVGSFLTIPGSFAERLDFSLTQNWFRILARGIELVTSGMIAEAVYFIFPKYWPRPKELVPSLAEMSIQRRVITFTLPVGIGLLIVLVVSDWLVAGKAAHQMVEIAFI